MADIPMDEPTRRLVERKLALLIEYADELRPLVVPGDEPGTPSLRRRAIERLVQLLVEVSSDINGLVAAAAGVAPPSTTRESFLIAVRFGVVPDSLSGRFVASYVGLRNRIVHDYDTLDATLVARGATRLLADAEEYARHVARWLRTGTGTPDG